VLTNSKQAHVQHQRWKPLACETGKAESSRMKDWSKWPAALTTC